MSGAAARTGNLEKYYKNIYQKKKLRMIDRKQNRTNKQRDRYNSIHIADRWQVMGNSSVYIECGRAFYNIIKS